MIDFPAFPKIFALGSPPSVGILDGQVELTEKVDGSQFAFGFLDGVLRFRSKGVEIHEGNVMKLFKPAVEYVRSIEVEIKRSFPDVTFYGETLYTKNHNVLTYNAVPKNNIMLFGAQYTDGHFEGDYSLLKAYSDILQIDVAPLLFRGNGLTFGDIQTLLEKESYLGGPKIEGVVIKRYEPALLANMVLPIWSAKYVSEKFKEVHRAHDNGEFNNKLNWEEYKKTFRTEARWQKAIQHLQESGVLTHSPKDIGPLIVEMNKDAIEECKEEILTNLWKFFGKDLVRTISSGFPEWYKHKIAEEATKGT